MVVMETTNNSSDFSSNKNEGIKPDIMNLENFTAVGFKILAEATKKSNTLPLGKARDLFKSYPAFHTIIDKQADYVLSMLTLLMKKTNSKGNIQKRDDDDKFEIVVDANDALLENVGISLDELAGIKKNLEPQLLTRKLSTVSGSWNRNYTKYTKGSTQLLNNLLNKSKNIEKPQLKFQDKVNNDPDVPFEPKITYKYNMLKPLSCIAEVGEDGFCQFTHPYEFELIKFKPLKEQLEKNPPTLYKSLEETPLILVTEPEQVKSMVEDLEKYKEIAIDLEHHSYRSFQGFTCLLQISTRDTDYIIDTLSLRSELQILNKVFTDPSVVKVFHGADCDIIWLQKDFGIYVVNMFDTHQAAKLLNYPKLSLAYLLSFYCNIDAQKHFQLADWRVRPLPEELIKYAREDTHYLLYIYDNLKNNLIEAGNSQTNLLEAVLSESTRICLKRYRKFTYDPEGYLDMYRRSKKLFDNRQKFALQKIFEWRDKTARESDESYMYVLPDHMMLNISEVLPREAQGILACCNPVPQPVRQNLMTLHHIILKARNQPLIKPILEEERFHRHMTSGNSFENPLQCPHDLNHDGEFRDDLPVLFSDKNQTNSDVNNFPDLSYLFSKPIIDVFESSSKPKKIKNQLSKCKIHLTPYNRYKLAKKFSESQVANILEKKQKNEEKIKKCQSRLENKEKSDDETNDSQEKLNSDESQISSNVVKEKSDKKKTKSKRQKFDKPDSPIPNKKLKGDSSVDLVQNPLYSPNPSENSSEMKKLPKKKQKKKTSHGKSEKQFEPFDYNSVNFNKYKSSETSCASGGKKRLKLKKRKGKKNFKISI